MPLSYLTLPRTPGAGEFYTWAFPSIVNLCFAYTGLIGDGTLYVGHGLMGPDVSGQAPVQLLGGPFSPPVVGLISNYSHTNYFEYPGGVGTIHTDDSGPYAAGGGIVFGGFNIKAPPANATITNIYPMFNITYTYASPGTSVRYGDIDCAGGLIVPNCANMGSFGGPGPLGQSASWNGPSTLVAGTPTQIFGSHLSPPYNPSTVSIDWSLYEIAIRLFQTSIQTPNQTVQINAVGLVIYYTVSLPLVAIGHGANCNSYSNGGYITPNFPPGNGTLLYDVEPMRKWGAANGVGCAVNLDAQRSCKDVLDELLIVGNSAGVYSGDKLKTIPYDEVSSAGNGAVYIAPTAGGPVYNITDKDLALTTEGGDSTPVKVTIKRRASCDNAIAIEHIERTLDYTHLVTSDLDAMGIALYGPRKSGALDASETGTNPTGGSQSILSISNATAAQAIASILTKREAAGVAQFEFDLKPEFFWLEAMDLVTITDIRVGLNAVPIRIKEVKENTDKSRYYLSVTAELFCYGLNHPDTKLTTAATGTLVQNNVDPGLVNTPIIFQPTPQMLPVGSPPQVWFVVSGSDPNYGGCIPYFSLDGGYSYPYTLAAIPNCTQGVLTADYPNNTDPDTADTLSLDLSMSHGTINSVSQANADLFSDPCYIAGATPPAYEVVCYSSVKPTGTYLFNLVSYIRRATLGTSAMDHPTSSVFAALNGSVLKINLPASWVGKTIYFKFQAYNTLNTQQNLLSNCTVYTYTPAGYPSSNYTTNPTTVISQPTSTSITTLAMTATWTGDGVTASYIARSFTITDPGTTPVTYYVTVSDPNRVGDGGVTLTSYCDTTPTRANSAGYIFLGKIIATHAAGNTGSVAGPNGIGEVLITVG